MTLFVIRDMLFAGPSDLAYPPVQRIARFYFSELSLFPWKATPFYVLFYVLIPRYFSRGAYLQTALYFVLTLVVCIYGYRSMVGPVSQIMYGETPGFNVYSLRRLFYTLTDLIPAIGLASAAKLLKDYVLFRRKEAALKLEKREAELNFLKARTNSHFLFNSLNNLYGLVRRNDPGAADSILKLSNIVRYILQECDTDTIPIENEIKVIQDYLDLENLRYDERLRVNVDLQVEDQQTKIPPLTLLPFVENAFKHGVSETRTDPFVDIRLLQTNGTLHFVVKNSWDHEVSAGEGGLGLKNVKRQLELIYGAQYELTITPADRIFTVELILNQNGIRGYEASKVLDYRG